MTLKRHLYTEDHEAFREVVREFVEREVIGNVERWDEQRLVDREVWLAAGKQGIIGLSTPEEYGGAGQRLDYRFRNVVMEELARVFASSLIASFALQDDVAIPYVDEIGNVEQRARWLPGMARGELIGAIAMTEPGTGSDLRAIRTSGKKVEGGWLINGAKTFITNGIHADLVVTVVRTDPDGGANALSLLVVERGMKGFSRGRKLDKVGLHGQDTAELAFDDVFVPDENLLGELGGGFRQLIRLLPLERLSIGAQAVALSEAAFAATVAYTDEREAFGKHLSDFQNTRFELAAIKTEIDVFRAYFDQAVRAYAAEDLTVVDAAKVKLFGSEMENRVVDRCLQLFGGYGYMNEYPVARLYRDARVQRIWGGANEIMKELIGRDIFGRR